MSKRPTPLNRPKKRNGRCAVQISAVSAGIVLFCVAMTRRELAAEDGDLL